jgi:hypothetical protein
MKLENFVPYITLTILTAHSQNLDCLNTVQEVFNVVRDKVMGSDLLMNEYFMDSIDIIASHLCDMFYAY